MIFPVFQSEISLPEFRTVSAVEDQYGFGLLMKTSGEPVYIFHFPRYNARNFSRDDDYYKNEMNELNSAAGIINDFVREKKSGIKINDDLRTKIIMKRWSRGGENTGQFVRIGKISPRTLFASAVCLLLMICPLFCFALMYFHPMFLDKMDIKFVWIIRGLLCLLVSVCLSAAVSFFAMVLHLFKDFRIIFDARFLILSRSIFGICYKMQHFEWQSIAFVKMQCIRKRTVQDFFRNPEGLNASINPAPCIIQLFDINRKSLGFIKDLLPNEGHFITAMLNNKISGPCPEPSSDDSKPETGVEN